MRTGVFVCGWIDGLGKGQHRGSDEGLRKWGSCERGRASGMVFSWWMRDDDDDDK